MHMDDDEHLKQLGLQIRKIRKSKQFSQEHLAHMSDLDRSYVSGIERGERNITFLTLLKIASTLNCSIADIVGAMPND